MKFSYNGFNVQILPSSLFQIGLSPCIWGVNQGYDQNGAGINCHSGKAKDAEAAKRAAKRKIDALTK